MSLPISKLGERQFPYPVDRRCVTTLLRDPRVCQLVELTLIKGNLSATGATAQALLAFTGTLVGTLTAYVLAQEGRDVAVFIDELVRRILI